MRALDRCFSIEDLRRLAERRLPRGIYDYLDLGTEDHIALRENLRAFERLRLKTKFLVDLTEHDWSVDLFGKRIPFPLAVAPTGIGGLCWHDGDMCAARAAAELGIPFTLATPATTSLERVSEAGGRLWYQLYMWEEMDLSYEMVARARDAGYEALVVTIDSALGRLREHNERNGFAFPFRPNARALWDILQHPRWMANVLLRSMIHSGLPVNANYPKRYQRIIERRAAPKPKTDAGMTWSDISRLRESWPGILIVKSVLSAHDARQAVDHGADGIVVSNHGGRSMDSAISTIEVLPDIVAEVGNETTIILDSGIRRGSDIVKALTLGADLAYVGRAPLYGLAAGGEQGARQALTILATEFEKTMGYLGCRRVDELSPDIIARPS